MSFCLKQISVFYCHWLFFYSSVVRVTLLVWWQEGHPACKKYCLWSYGTMALYITNVLLLLLLLQQFAKVYFWAGAFIPNNQDTIPPTSFFSPSFPIHPFPLPISLPSHPFLSCREVAPLKPARGLEERCKLPQWSLRRRGWGKAPSDIDFGVFWEGKKLIWQQLLYGFLYTEIC